MQIKWTPSARQSLGQIRSIHFTQQETKRYKVELVRKIQQKVAVVLETMPVNEPSWQGTYRILFDKYKCIIRFRKTSEFVI